MKTLVIDGHCALAIRTAPVPVAGLPLRQSKI